MAAATPLQTVGNVVAVNVLHMAETVKLTNIIHGDLVAPRIHVPRNFRYPYLKYHGRC